MNAHSGMESETPVRAEEVIAEVYRQILQIQNEGNNPVKIIMSKGNWMTIQRYRQSLGVLSNSDHDYLDEDRLFGLKIWYDNDNQIRVVGE